MQEAKKLYLQTVTKLGDVETEYQKLVKRLDEMEAVTSVLKAKVEISESEEKAVCDAYFLGKTSDRDLTDAQRKIRDAREAVSAHSKMLESLARCITSREKELNILRKQIDSLRHQMWSNLFEAKASAISETIKTAVKELICIGLNCSMGRDFILPKVFGMPTNNEIQQIYKKVSADLGIE